MDPPTAAFALDAPLPPALTGRAQGWFTRYRRYPVFSGPWVRGRTLAWMVPVGLALLVIYSAALANPTSPAPWGALIQITLEFLVPLIAGPLLGRWVRRQGWPPDREFRALVLAIGGLVAALVVAVHLGAEPMKQQVAEWTGAVDASGKRKRVAVAIGVQVMPEREATSKPDRPEGVAQGPTPNEDLPAAPPLVNMAIQGSLMFWMAGGLALLGWRRERAGLVALQREQELAQAQAQRREAELRLSVLAAQVEPHFLFNTLAGVRSAIATDPARASDMIDRLVEYLRAAIPRLRSDGSAQANVGAQFDIVRAYLGLMAARMPRLQYRVQAPPDLLAAHCPPLMLISLAENAVKHGVEMKVGPACIDVTATRDADGQLSITVADDGAGFGASPAGSGIGLANIRERLTQLYGDDASLTLKSRPEGGVAATLTLPLEWPDRSG